MSASCKSFLPKSPALARSLACSFRWRRNSLSRMEERKVILGAKQRQSERVLYKMLINCLENSWNILQWETFPSTWTNHKRSKSIKDKPSHSTLHLRESFALISSRSKLQKPTKANLLCLQMLCKHLYVLTSFFSQSFSLKQLTDAFERMTSRLSQFPPVRVHLATMLLRKALRCVREIEWQKRESETGRRETFKTNRKPTQLRGTLFAMAWLKGKKAYEHKL